MTPEEQRVEARAAQLEHSTRLRSAWRFLALFLLILILLIGRRPDAVTNPQFWAEDGPVFFYGQVTRPGLSMVFEPYSGYLLVIPRLVAALAVWFPAAYIPLVFNWCAFLLAAFSLSLFSLNRYRYLLESDALRIAVCLIAASAFQADELIGNITCLQFFLFLIVLLATVQPASAFSGKRAWTAYPAAAGALAAGLSGPLVVILLPLAAYFVIRYRDRARLAPAAALLAIAIQLASLVHQPPHPAGPPESVNDIVVTSVAAVVYRVVMTPVLGERAAISLASADTYVSVMLVAVIVLAVWLATLWCSSTAERRWKVAGGLYVILASVVLAVVSRSLAQFFSPVSGITWWRSERYYLIGGMVFAYLAALSIECWMLAKRQAAQVAALAAVFAAGILVNFRTFPFIDFHWSVYAPGLERWMGDMRSGRPTAALVIPLNPSWQLRLAGTTDGSVVEVAGDGTVYRIEGSRKRPLTSSPRPEDIGIVPASALSAMPTGPPMR